MSIFKDFFGKRDDLEKDFIASDKPVQEKKQAIQEKIMQDIKDRSAEAKKFNELQEAQQSHAKQNWIYCPTCKEDVQRVDGKCPKCGSEIMETTITEAMVMMPEEIVAKLPKLGSQDGKDPSQVTIIVKFFDPTGSWTWYATEGEPTGETIESGAFKGQSDWEFFGYVQGFEGELGYFTLGQLSTAKEGMKGMQALPIERDRHFSGKTLADVMLKHEGGAVPDDVTPEGNRTPIESKVTEDIKSWRARQKRGAIMKPSTFKEIEKKAEEAGASDPKAVAGAAYWKTAKAKYAKTHEAVEGEFIPRTISPEMKEWLVSVLELWVDTFDEEHDDLEGTGDAGDKIFRLPKEIEKIKKGEPLTKEEEDDITFHLEQNFYNELAGDEEWMEPEDEQFTDEWFGHNSEQGVAQ